MIFSKSFGYSLRGVLYVALMRDENRKIQIDEIANRLSVPRHFLGKIMNKIVKAGVISSTKGPHGGFSLNDSTLGTPLITLISVTEGMDQFDSCVLRLRKCNHEHPCPLHHRMESYKEDLKKLYTNTTIGDLLQEDKPDFIKSLATI
ncbi:MAG: Rrf2 family transcriptional regulator [Bacteroidetes bacterium]|nr:Rrf2 family transcriptional regulator [Bacteroidota bacterium]